MTVLYDCGILQHKNTEDNKVSTAWDFNEENYKRVSSVKLFRSLITMYIYVLFVLLGKYGKARK